MARKLCLANRINAYLRTCRYWILIPLLNTNRLSILTNFDINEAMDVEEIIARHDSHSSQLYMQSTLLTATTLQVPDRI